MGLVILLQYITFLLCLIVLLKKILHISLLNLDLYNIDRYHLQDQKKPESIKSALNVWSISKEELWMQTKIYWNKSMELPIVENQQVYFTGTCS